MIGRGWWVRRRRRSQRFELKPRHLAMVFCPIAIVAHSLLWWDFGLPWYDATTFEGYAKLRYLCAERPFLRPDTRTLDGRPPRGDGIFGSGSSGSELELPPWDGINLFGGEYLPGEEAQPEYVAQLAHASVDGGTGYVFDDRRIYHVNYCNDAEFSAPLEEPEWPEVSQHARLATIAGKHTGHYFHWFAEELPRLLLLEEFFAAQAQAQAKSKAAAHGGSGTGGGFDASVGLALQDDDVKLLLPAHTEASHGFIRETLRHLGLPPSRMLSATPGTRYHAEELYVPTMTCLGRPSREMAERVRARFAPKAFGGPVRRRIILIERHHQSTEPASQGQGQGQGGYEGSSLLPGGIGGGGGGGGGGGAVSNYQELKARLEFEFPEDEVSSYDGTTSLPRTIALFSTARVIIGPHGAGLVNMLFAPNDTAIVELQLPRQQPQQQQQRDAGGGAAGHGSGSGGFGSGGGGNRAPNMNYWHLASALGLEHWTLFAAAADQGQGAGGGGGGAAGAVHAVHAAVNPILQVVEDILLRSDGKEGPRRPLSGGLLSRPAAAGSGEGEAAEAALLSMLETDPDDPPPPPPPPPPHASASTGGMGNGTAAASAGGDGGGGGAEGGLSAGTEKRLRSALSLHAHKMEGVGEHVMVIRADEITTTTTLAGGAAAAASSAAGLAGAGGEQGIPWCKPSNEEHATERAIAKEVRTTTITTVTTTHARTHAYVYVQCAATVRCTCTASHCRDGRDRGLG